MTNKNTTMRRAALTATALSSALLLAACTGHKKDATQSVARVDGTEITVHQLKYQLQREHVRPDQEEAASRKVLDQLIDEQLLVEKAEEIAALMARLDALAEMRERTDQVSVRRAIHNLRTVLANKLGGHRMAGEDLDPETIHEIVALIDEAARKIERL